WPVEAAESLPIRTDWNGLTHESLSAIHQPPRRDRSAEPGDHAARRGEL
ncbi:hypothetical protein PSYPI_46284, partial [Pseudomonas syringae pv. pisi str. 1704B]